MIWIMAARRLAPGGGVAVWWQAGGGGVEDLAGQIGPGACGDGLRSWPGRGGHLTACCGCRGDGSRCGPGHPRLHSAELLRRSGGFVPSSLAVQGR